MLPIRRMLAGRFFPPVQKGWAEYHHQCPLRLIKHDVGEREHSAYTERRRLLFEVRMIVCVGLLIHLSAARKLAGVPSNATEAFLTSFNAPSLSSSNHVCFCNLLPPAPTSVSNWPVERRCKNASNWSVHVSMQLATNSNEHWWSTPSPYMKRERTTRHPIRGPRVN